MPRALWSGAISFGLVNVPVRMYSAISEHNVHFNLLHAKSGARIHYKKVTDSHPRDIPDDQIVKGYEVSDGEYVTLTDEEIAAAHVEGDKVIEIHAFVPLEEIDPIAFERTYYLGPAEGAERVYSLLARALESSGLVGIASFVFHDRDQLACLRVSDGAILLERMYFADEIRDGDGILPGRKQTVDKRELKLAVDLIERMKGSFDHSAYHDRYTERLKAIVAKKRKGETITVPEVEERRMPDDLMAALEASLGEALAKRRKAPKSRARAPKKSRTKAKARRKA
jgi:DNA end-binding protein Ku